MVVVILMLLSVTAVDNCAGDSSLMPLLLLLQLFGCLGVDFGSCCCWW